jgi:deoxycytidine triphosphate deaminase
MPGPSFATSDQEAASRYERWKSIDPFPEVAPALLNSADIADYVAATGMIYPFYDQPTIETLKSASYEVAIEGPYVYWDEHQLRHSDVLARDQELTLPAQTIVFVTLEPMFRVPDYLAIRFNLRISRVYQGLLLGTGPLVDPGFAGRLSLPLHNLTLNNYPIKGGEGLIWLEVTKVSPLKDQPQPEGPPARRGTFHPFEASKLNLDLDDYLRKAFRGRPIASSIPVAVEEAGRHAENAANQAATARQEAQNARRDAERLRNVGLVAAILGLAALLAALATIAIQAFTLVHEVDTRLAGQANQAAQARAEQAQQSAQTNAQQAQQNGRLCAIEQALKLPKSASCP